MSQSIGKINGHTLADTKAREKINSLDSQIKDIANDIVTENTGFKATTLKGILQEIYNVLSKSSMADGAFIVIYF